MVASGIPFIAGNKNAPKRARGETVKDLISSTYVKVFCGDYFYDKLREISPEYYYIPAQFHLFLTQILCRKISFYMFPPSKSRAQWAR